jgi:hypothetical protein
VISGVLSLIPGSYASPRDSKFSPPPGEMTILAHTMSAIPPPG